MMTRIRTLLVDDAPALRRLLRLALERHGTFEVVGEAADGAEGVRVANECRPDLVLLDLSMPTMDGLEALPQILANPVPPVVVVLSAFEGHRMAARVQAMGAIGYIEKGLPPSQLISSILGHFFRAVRLGQRPAPARAAA